MKRHWFFSFLLQIKLKRALLVRLLMLCFIAAPAGAFSQDTLPSFSPGIPDSLLRQIHWQLLVDNHGAMLLQGNARAKIWAISNDSVLKSLFVLSYDKSSVKRRDRRSEIAGRPSRDEAKAAMLDGGSTAGSMAQATNSRNQGEIQGGHGVRGSGGFVFPVLTAAILAARGAKMTYDYLKGLPLINLGERHLEMMDVLWQAPDQTAMDWYSSFYQHQDSETSFLAFAADIDTLRDQKIVEARSIEGQDHPRYNPMETPQSLLIRAREDLNGHEWTLENKTRLRLVAIVNRFDEELPASESE